MAWRWSMLGSMGVAARALPCRDASCSRARLLTHWCCCLCVAAKLVMIADNCPPLRKSEVEYYAMLAKTIVHHYTGCTL